MNKNEILLGDNGDTLAIATVNDKQVVTEISRYYLITPKQSYDGHAYLEDAHDRIDSVTFKGITVEVGKKLPKVLPKVAKRLLAVADKAYKAYHGNFCNDCGAFHDTEQDYDRSFVYCEDGGIVCKTCATFEDVARPLKEVGDLFKAADMQDIKIPRKYKEVDTLFCDSSGFGADYEAALTKEGAERAVVRILKENKGKKLFCGLTGIGQFQVYVTIWTERKK